MEGSDYSSVPYFASMHMILLIEVICTRELLQTWTATNLHQLLAESAVCTGLLSSDAERIEELSLYL